MCSSYDPVLFSESKTLVHKLKQLNRIMTDNYYCIVIYYSSEAGYSYDNVNTFYACHKL